MSRFDDEGAPLIGRVLRDRWNLPVAGVARVVPTVLELVRRRLRGIPVPPEEPEEEAGDTPSDEEEPETYGEHGELLHAHHPSPESASHPHLNLKG